MTDRRTPPLDARSRALFATALGLGRSRGVDISWVLPALAVGAAPTEAQVRRLSTQGLSAILDLRTDREREPPWATAALGAARLRRLPVIDGCAPTAGQLEDACGWIRRELAADDGRVLVCCVAGQGRSVTVAIAALISVGRTLPDALMAVCAKRLVANPTEAQLAALRTFARDVGRENRDMA